MYLYEVILGKTIEEIDEYSHVILIVYVVKEGLQVYSLPMGRSCCKNYCRWNVFEDGMLVSLLPDCPCNESDVVWQREGDCPEVQWRGDSLEDCHAQQWGVYFAFSDSKCIEIFVILQVLSRKSTPK